MRPDKQIKKSYETARAAREAEIRGKESVSFLSIILEFFGLAS
jgi:hypothetical protein